MDTEPFTEGSNALAVELLCKWKMGAYLRISKEDKRAGESASIINQRALIYDFIKRAEEFTGAIVIEYVDDGLSGATIDRDEYKRMMNDVEFGKINCIIVKDLSRIGRNMLETDELLMIYLVERNIRFISIGDNYDSFIHPLSILEIATINLFNQDYLRDLAQKSISSRLTKVKRGEHLGRFGPFGYIKSKTEKNKLSIDDEAADYVRLIFSLAIEGIRKSEIANMLNEQAVPTPSEYRKKQYGHAIWHTIDPEYHFWTEMMVGNILTNEQYTGKIVCKSYGCSDNNLLTTAKRAKAEWIIVPNTHEAIISEDEYMHANDMIKRRIKKIAANKIFISKIKCASCGHVMRRLRKESVFVCNTKRFTNHYHCIEQAIPQSIIESVVLESIRVYIDTMIDREETNLENLRKLRATEKTITGRLKTEQQAINLLENSITQIFTSMVMGDMTKEAFSSKKEAIKSSIEKKKMLIETLKQKLLEITEGKTTGNESLNKLYTLRNIEKLDRETVDNLIDHIFVHDINDIEIVWYDSIK